ncbi:MAG: alpha/beta fold hydrolase [Cytophagales bacterium]|nr:alpha/beta fold hydrolase [Armatimonadota bacterium]
MASRKGKRNDGEASAAGSVARGLLAAGALIGAAAIANAYIFYKTPPLTSKLPGGEVRYWPTPDGDVFYKKAGDGPPLLLVHSIGAGCSSFEFRFVFESLAAHHTVYALDLLGFGKSDKPPLDYTHETYIQLLSDFAKQVMRVGENGKEADVIATSLSAAYIIAAAQRDPLLFRRLVLICPTGIEELAKPAGTGAAAVRGLFKLPILGASLYNAIASKLGIRGYLARNIYADATKVTDEVVEQYHAAAHQPGGENVLPSFISGYLNVNIAEAFRKVVDLPLIVWGQDAKETPISQAEAFLIANPAAKLEVIEAAGLLPHEEQPEAFLAAVRPFLTTAEDPADSVSGTKTAVSSVQ